jgi:hypothetical protein
VCESLARNKGLRKACANALARGGPYAVQLVARSSLHFWLQMVRSTWVFAADLLRLLVSYLSCGACWFWVGRYLSGVSLGTRSTLEPYRNPSKRIVSFDFCSEERLFKLWSRAGPALCRVACTSLRGKSAHLGSLRAFHPCDTSDGADWFRCDA